MKTPFSVENTIWEAITNKDKKTVDSYLTENAVIIYKGKRYAGDTFAKEIGNSDIRIYTLDCIEVVMSMGNTYQIVYGAKVYAKAEDTSDIAGTYNITTTWVDTGNDVEVVFSMIDKVA